MLLPSAGMLLPSAGMSLPPGFGETRRDLRMFRSGKRWSRVPKCCSLQASGRRIATSGYSDRAKGSRARGPGRRVAPSGSPDRAKGRRDRASGRRARVFACPFRLHGAAIGLEDGAIGVPGAPLQLWESSDYGRGHPSSSPSSSAKPNDQCPPRASRSCPMLSALIDRHCTAA